MNNKVVGLICRNNKEKVQEEVFCKCGCGKKKFKYDKNWVERIYLPGHNNQRKKFYDRTGIKHSEESKIKYGKSIKKWWDNNKDSDVVKERNRKIGENTSKKLSGFKRDGNFKEKIRKVLLKSWGDEKWKERRLRAQRKGMNLSPNKPEKILIRIIKENNLPFNYVGDGKVWIGGFNPDFLSKNPKHIIEVFGDYWHNLPSYKKRDKRRLETYKKYGYTTLIIWEGELNNPLEVIKKIKGFLGGN